MTDKELASWAASCPDHFYLQGDVEDFKTCDDCLQSHIDALEERKVLEKTVAPLRGMELFAGQSIPSLCRIILICVRCGRARNRDELVQLC